MGNWAVSVAGAIAVFFAAVMAVQRSLYAAAVCLLIVLLQTAAFFFLAGAPLLAFLQIMIYAGAVMVMIVVTIMSAPAPAEHRTARLWMSRPLGAAAVGALAGEVLAVAFRDAAPAGGLGAALPLQASLGPILFGPYAVATEAVTLLMLLASLALVGRVKRRAQAAP